MTEADARDWLASNFPVVDTQKLDRFVALLRNETDRQSLIARSTLDEIYGRHIVDSAQLIRFAEDEGLWLDIGSGGGLPGIVVAILRDAPIFMVDPRRKRVEFLCNVIDQLGLSNATARLGKAQAITALSTVISARAVAPIADIFAWTQRAVSRETRFILPRGQSWASELEIARHAWHGRFHVEHSLTNPESGIVIADAVAPR